MGRSIRRVGAGCAGVLVGLAIGVTPAVADSPVSARLTPSGAPRGVPALPATAGATALPATAVATGQSTVAAQSEYLGGYDVIPPEGVSSDGATFTMPTIKCPDTAVRQLDALGEAINNAAGDFYQQGGDTDALSAGLLFCDYGEAEYGIDALANGGGEFSDYTDVSPGDRIQTRVEELASGDALATTTDLTTGQSVSSEGASLGDESQIYEGLIPDVADESAQNDFSIVKFKSVTLSRSQVGGVPLAQTDPTATDLNQSGTVMVAAGKIAARTPGRFILTEKSTR